MLKLRENMANQNTSEQPSRAKEQRSNFHGACVAIGEDRL